MTFAKLNRENVNLCYDDGISPYLEIGLQGNIRFPTEDSANRYKEFLIKCTIEYPKLVRRLKKAQKMIAMMMDASTYKGRKESLRRHLEKIKK